MDRRHACVSVNRIESDTVESKQTIHERDRAEAHSLDEDFSYKRPYGFILCGKTYTNIKNWISMYLLVCELLSQRNPTRFAALPDNPNFIHRLDNLSFSRNANNLRKPNRLLNGIYVETNLSANSIVKRIGQLLDLFSIERSEFAIYLREDRDTKWGGIGMM